jgi:hypothetical protein
MIRRISLRACSDDMKIRNQILTAHQTSPIYHTLWRTGGILFIDYLPFEVNVYMDQRSTVFQMIQ